MRLLPPPADEAIRPAGDIVPLLWWKGKAGLPIPHFCCDQKKTKMAAPVAHATKTLNAAVKIKSFMLTGPQGRMRKPSTKYEMVEKRVMQRAPRRLFPRIITLTSFRVITGSSFLTVKGRQDEVRSRPVRGALAIAALPLPQREFVVGGVS